MYTDVPAWPDFPDEQEAPWHETPVVYFLDCSCHFDRALTPEAFDIYCNQLKHIFNNETEFVLVFGNTGDRPYPKEDAPRPKNECRVAGGAARRTFYHARMTYLRETYLALQAGQTPPTFKEVLTRTAPELFQEHPEWLDHVDDNYRLPAANETTHKIIGWRSMGYLTFCKSGDRMEHYIHLLALPLLSAIRVVHSNYYRSNRHGPSWQGMFKEILNFGRRAFAMWGALGPFRYSLCTPQGVQHFLRCLKAACPGAYRDEHDFLQRGLAVQGQAHLLPPP